MPPMPKYKIEIDFSGVDAAREAIEKLIDAVDEAMAKGIPVKAILRPTVNLGELDDDTAESLAKGLPTNQTLVINKSGHSIVYADPEF